MLYLYDKAITEKFTTVMPGKVIYASVDKFYERYLLANDNKGLVLPALSIWRSSLVLDKGSIPTQLRVGNIRYPNQEKFLAEQLYSAKIELSYQLDVWTANDIDRDDMLKEILYFLTLYPYISIEYKEHKFTYPIFIGDITDSTDIAGFENTGDIYRLTIPLQVPDARILYFDDVKLLKHINVTYLIEGEEKPDV